MTWTWRAYKEDPAALRSTHPGASLMPAAGWRSSTEGRSPLGDASRARGRVLGRLPGSPSAAWQLLLAGRHTRGLYASGDGDAMEGNSVIFFWMESAPILSFSFRAMAPWHAAERAFGNRKGSFRSPLASYLTRNDWYRLVMFSFWRVGHPTH